jgi:hypothetical protein
MGSELIVAVLKMDRGRTPDWAAAEAALAAMSAEAVRSAYMKAMDLVSTTRKMEGSGLLSDQDP